MATNKDRLKDKIILVMDECAAETDDPQESKENFANKLAEAIIYELISLTIVGTAGGNAINITSIS